MEVLSVPLPTRIMISELISVSMVSSSQQIIGKPQDELV